MFFVIEGTLEYSLPCSCWEVRDSFLATESEDILGLSEELGGLAKERARAGRALVRPGQWCCEAALWIPEVHLASPFVAKEKTELILLNTEEFQKIIAMYGNSRTAAEGSVSAACLVMSLALQRPMMADDIHIPRCCSEVARRPARIVSPGGNSAEQLLGSRGSGRSWPTIARCWPTLVALWPHSIGRCWPHVRRSGPNLANILPLSANAGGIRPDQSWPGSGNVWPT